MIRAYLPEDFMACRDLFVRVFNAPPWNDRWTDETASARLWEFTAHKRFVGFTLWEGGTLLGAVFAYAKSHYKGDEIFIEELFVAPDCQRQGHGAALMEALEAYAKARGLVSITLLTARGYPSFAFYEKRGYRALDWLAFMHKRG